jgi:hypothetical protein
MTLGEHQQAFSRDLVKLLLKGFDLGYEARIGEVERPLEMQEIYVKTGRSKTMNSMHLKKCAADIHWMKDGKLCYPSELGEFWESLGPLNRWGGNFDRDWRKDDNFKDGPHFERRA